MEHSISIYEVFQLLKLITFCSQFVEKSQPSGQVHWTQVFGVSNQQSVDSSFGLDTYQYLTNIL